MRNSFKVFLWFFTLLVTLAVPGWAETTEKQVEPTKFSFNYDQNGTLVYAMGSRMMTSMDMKTGGQNIGLRMAVSLAYQIKLTPLSSKDGIYTMSLEPRELEADWDIVSPFGHIVMKLRDKEITASIDGTVVIDTAQGVGLAQAEDLKKEISALYLSGEIDLDSFGKARSFRGDAAFVEFWEETAQIQLGFWGILFPDRPVACGESWTESLVVDKIGQFRLEGEGLREEHTFTRQPDLVREGQMPLATFELKAPFSYRDLTGLMGQTDQNAKMDISKFDRETDGIFHFDPELGVLTDGVINTKGVALIKTKSADQEVAMEMRIEASNDFKKIAEPR